MKFGSESLTKLDISGLKIYARINDCRQYSEDAWETIAHIKEITPETTVGELLNWQSGKCPIYKNHTAEDFKQIIINLGS